jgi:hypothetical protein
VEESIKNFILSWNLREERPTLPVDEVEMQLGE